MYKLTFRYWTEAYALAAPPTAEEVAQWFAAQPDRVPTRGIPAHLLQASPLFGQRAITDGRIFGSSARIFGGSSPSALISPGSATFQNTSGSPPAPRSWLALLLEGRTTPAFIALCEQKLIQQEDFSSAELLAEMPVNEFTCEYLTSLGITAKGLQIKLVNFHKELRETHRGAIYQQSLLFFCLFLSYFYLSTAETSLVTSPMLNAQDEGPRNHPHSPACVEATDGAVDTAYVHVTSTVGTD